MTHNIVSLLLTALTACLLQNVVFCSGYGVSEMLRISMRPKFFGFVSIMILYMSLGLSVLAYLADTYITYFKFADIYVKCLEYGGILLILYLVTVFIMLAVLKLPKHYTKRTGVAAFNTLVFAIPFLNESNAFSLWNSIGNAVGCAAAFIIASLLVSVSSVCVNNDDMPNAFRGIPALFIFVGILAMAFMGFGA